MAPDDLVLFVPVTGVLMGTALALVAMHLHYCRMSEALWLAHTECLAVIAKGTKPEAAALLLAATFGVPCGSCAGLRRSGLTLIFAGGAITLALWRMDGSWLWWGLVPVAGGLGKLLAWWVEMRDQHRPWLGR